MLKFSRSIYAR